MLQNSIQLGYLCSNVNIPLFHIYVHATPNCVCNSDSFDSSFQAFIIMYYLPLMTASVSHICIHKTPKLTQLKLILVFTCWVTKIQISYSAYCFNFQKANND